MHTFFLKLTRQSFWELGINDPSVTEYVADVLTDFARAENLTKIRSQPEKKLESVVEVPAESKEDTLRGSPTLLQERAVRKHVGDYALFMSGFFRSYVEHHGFLEYYLKEGSRSYWTVSELDLSMYRTGFLLYQELSKKFELVIPRGLATGTPYSSMGGWEQARLRKVVIVRGRFTIILCFR